MPEKDVTEGGSSFKATKEGGGYSVPDDSNTWIKIYILWPLVKVIFIDWLLW